MRGWGISRHVEELGGPKAYLFCLLSYFSQSSKRHGSPYKFSHAEMGSFIFFLLPDTPLCSLYRLSHVL